LLTANFKAARGERQRDKGASAPALLRRARAGPTVGRICRERYQDIGLVNDGASNQQGTASLKNQQIAGQALALWLHIIRVNPGHFDWSGHGIAAEGFSQFLVEDDFDESRYAVFLRFTGSL